MLVWIIKNAEGQFRQTNICIHDSVINNTTNDLERQMFRMRKKKFSEYIEIDADVFDTDASYIDAEINIILEMLAPYINPGANIQLIKDWLAYTIVHKQSIIALASSLRDRPYMMDISKRLFVHDIDKLIMYTLYIPMGIEPKKINELHVVNNQHHLKSIESATFYDLMEAWFDYESSSLTKVDKPLNAYDFIKKKKPEYLDAFNPVFKVFSSYNKPCVYNHEMHCIHREYLVNTINQFIGELNKGFINLNNPAAVSSAINTLLQMYR